MNRFHLTLEAADDLNEIYEYIARDNPEAAERVRSEFYTAIQHLAKMPAAGHFRRDLTDKPVRFWRIRSYLIVYRPRTKPLEIVRVLHGARDVRRILKAREGGQPAD